MYGSKTTVVVTCQLLHVQSDLHACMHTSFRPSINQKYKLTEDDTFILELNIDILNY